MYEYSSLRKPNSIKKSDKMTPISTEREKYQSILETLQNICVKFQKVLDYQNKKLANIETKFSEILISRFDKLIDINSNMNENMQKIFLNNNFHIPKKSSQSQQKIIPIMSSMKLSGTQDFSMNGKIINKKKFRKSKPIRLLSHIKNKSKEINVSDFEQNLFPQTPANQIQIVSTAQNNYNQLTSFEKLKDAILNQKNGEELDKIFKNWVGDLYTKNAQTCFEQYSSKKIIFEDMKINFSWNIMKEVLYLFKFYNKSKQFKGCRQMEAKSKFIMDFDKESRNILDFLIKKYPPSRRRIFDSQLTEKIVEFNNTSNPKFDMILNADIDMETNINKFDYTKNIKILLNKLISQTKKQYPAFKHKMKQIFAGREQASLIGNSYHQVQYIIGSKIKDGTPLYTEQQLEYPGLKLKAPQLLRILLKWMEQLKSYILLPEKIKNNKYGFKSTEKGKFVILNRDKKQFMCDKLKQIKITELEAYRQQIKKNISSLIIDVFTISSEGFEGFQYLNQDQVTIAKLSQFFNEGMETMTLFILNKMIHNLTTIAQEKLLYVESQDNQITQKIDLLTFNVLDLLRCKCTGSKAEIFRIYNEILSNKDYFQIIRVKNKLNQVTRDILINLKLKKSFLICQVQLSLGQQQQQVNDHFCHYLYELSRSSYHVIFQCSNQLVNLDPKMAYFTPDKKIQFKSSSKNHSFCQMYLSTKNDQSYCHYGHEDKLMKYHHNTIPFCCSICLTYVSGNTFSTQYLKCDQCQSSICPPCISNSKYYDADQAFLRQNYIFRYLKIEALTQFLQEKPFFMQFCDQKTLHNKINQALTFKKYIIIVRFDSKGLKYNIVKKYRNQVIDSFYTIDQIKKDKTQINLVPNLNGIFLPKTIELKKLKELEHHKKFHIKQNWFELEEIFQAKKIDEVFCLVGQSKKKVLIIDIIQTEQQITHYVFKKEVKNIIAQENKLGFGELELACRHISNCEQLNLIKNKQKITSINLFDNKIEDPSGLTEFINIISLDLRSNHITNIHKLLSFNQIEILILKNNNLSDKLPTINFPSLKTLDLSFNNITQITSIQLPQIINLNLSDNKLINLPIMIAPNLQILLFQNNTVKDINNLMKSQIPQVKRINGKSNGIGAELPELHFLKLQFFNLSFNKIMGIANLQKSSLLQIKSINLFENRISGEIPCLKAMKMIRINLSNNRITNIKNLEISKLEQITQLELENNVIEGNLPYMNFLKLKILNMKNNKLKNIEMIEKSHIPLIEKIDLSKNAIQSPFPFLKLKKLKILDLSINLINNIEKLENSKLPRVTHIKLNHNRITKNVPVLNFEELVSLQLNDNSIEQLSCLREIHLLPKLKRIGLERNKIGIGQNLQITRDSTQQQLDHQSSGICYLWSRPIKLDK